MSKVVVSKITQKTMFNKSWMIIEEAKFWFVEKRPNPQVRARLNMVIIS